MCNNNSINDIIKYFASYDTSQGSSTEIDTKKEYDLLGAYLNGSFNILTRDDEFIKCIDLNKNVKNKLIGIMDSRSEEFGKWTNVFASDAEFDEKYATLYVYRLLDYKLKLEELKENKKEYSKYYKDNKKEIKQAENFVKEYCKKNRLNIKDYSIENLEKLEYTCKNGMPYDIKYAAELKSMLDNASDKFVLTEDIVKKYKYDIDSIISSDEYLINDFTDEQKIKLRNAVSDYIKVFDEEFQDIDNINIHLVLNETMKIYKNIDTMKECNSKIQDIINNPYNKENLKNTVDEYIKNNNINEIGDIPEGVDIGNGKFDKTSTQQTQNCWAHAGINSLLSSNIGRSIIESNYYHDEKTGVIAIHLQEAENMGLHGGIFIVTPQEIADSQTTIASGEGDISAYLLAIQKFFDEVNANPKLRDDGFEQWQYAEMDKGNAGFRFYEIMFGGKHVRWSPITREDMKFQNGIAAATNMEAENLYKMLEEGNGAVTVSLRQMAHNISIVGVKDGKFLIQESNNYEDFFDGHVGEDDERIFTVEEPVNDRPTFGITKENFNMYQLGAINYIKWK